MSSSLKAASFLAELHRARPSPGEQSLYLQIWNSFTPHEKNELIDLAEQNSALIWTLKQLKRCGANVENELTRIQPQLEIEKKRRERIVALTENFHQNEIDLIVLKGNAVGYWIYQDPFYKRMNDFDFLIRHDQLLQVKKALWNLGYRSSGPLLGGKENPKSTHHLSPWIHESLDCILGIHWNLVSPKREEKVPVEDLWSDRVRMNDLPAYRLSTEHTLMHLALHLPKFKTGVRELSDLLNVASYAADRETAIHRLATTAESWNATRSLKAALEQALSIQPGSILSKVYPDVKPLSEGARIIHYRTLHLSRVEKAFARSWLSENPRSRFLGWIATWKFTFFAPLKDACAILRIPMPRSKAGNLWARTRTPFKIWSALCQEHGTVAITIATLINFGNALKSGLLWAAQPEKNVEPSTLEIVLDRLE